MSTASQISVVIAAYNEEEGLPVVLGQLERLRNDKRFGLAIIETIVVNDGSSDKTAEVASKYECKVISHPENKGKGKAMQTGIANSSGRDIIFVDADGTYPVEEITVIIDKLKDYDAVFTVREPGNIPALNLIGNKIISNAIKIFCGFAGHDPLSGLYGIRRSVMEKLNVEATNFSIETEIAVKTAVMGFKTTEIPIKYNRRLGRSKLSLFGDGLKIVKFMFSLIVRYNPLMSFILPGAFLCLVGAILFLLTVSGDFRLAGDVVLGIHTFIFSVMIFLVGFQIVIQGVILDIYAVKYGYKKADMVVGIFKSLFFRILLILGVAILMVGIIITIRAAFLWVSSGFQPYFETRKVIIALLLNLLGLQLIFSSLIGRVFAREIKNGKL